MKQAPKPKVVLYNPDADFYTLPLALLALASALDRKRYRVVVVDGRLEENPAEPRHILTVWKAGYRLEA